MHTNSHSKLFLTGLFLFLSACVACSRGQQPASIKAPEVIGTPSVQASPVPSPTLDTILTKPVGPVGQTTRTGEASTVPEEQRVPVGVTVMPAKPMLTPTPDPFPPRPTPTIVMNDGKIVQQWPAPTEAANLISPVKGNPDAWKIGRVFYMQRCVDCHGNTGKGNGYRSKTVFKPPTNLASQMVQANTDGELFWKITKGRSPMPASGVRFTDEQRWYIVAYLRAFKP